MNGIINLVAFGIISGIISALIVTFILYLIENHRWKKVKRILLIEYDGDLNRITTSCRLFLEVKTNLINKIDKNDKFIRFIEEDILKKYNSFENTIKYPKEHKMKNFVSDIKERIFSLERLKQIFLSFKFISPKYIHSIFQIQNKMNASLITYTTFPEVSLKEYNNEFEFYRDPPFKYLNELIKMILFEKRILAKEIKKF